MTTSRVVIRRERARDWPLLQDLPIQNDVGVLSIEVVRAPQADLASAVGDAAEVLSASWLPALDDVRKLLLVAAGRTVDPSSKVAAYNTERLKLWAVLEGDGLPIPNGHRLESRVQYDDGSFGFIGLAEIESGGLPKALEVTRRVNAVCIGTAMTVSQVLIDEINGSIAKRSSAARSVLKLLTARLDRGDSLARAFGEFDDRNVGVEVFAKDNVLDEIEAIAGQRS